MKCLSNKYIHAAAVCTMLAPFVVFAQDDAVRVLRQNATELRKQTVQDSRALRVKVGDELHTLNEEFKLKREEVKKEIKGMDASTTQKRLQKFRGEANKKREEVKKEIEQQREEFRKKAEERKAELKKKIGEARAQRVENYFLRMTERMDAAIDRLDKLADRIESRINKIHDMGKDVSKPQAELDRARAAVAATQATVVDAKAKFAELANSDKPKDAFAQVQALVKNAEAKLKEAHAALVEVINSIKQGRLDVEATSTPQGVQ